MSAETSAAERRALSSTGIARSSFIEISDNRPHTHSLLSSGNSSHPRHHLYAPQPHGTIPTIALSFVGNRPHAAYPGAQYVHRAPAHARITTPSLQEPQTLHMPTSPPKEAICCTYRLLDGGLSSCCCYAHSLSHRLLAYASPLLTWAKYSNDDITTLNMLDSILAYQPLTAHWGCVPLLVSFLI